MRKELRISDIARLFDVPVSTLRYWEREGLVEFERDKGNRYRSATIMTIRNLCDITFYRKLSVPVEQLRKLFDKDYLEIEDILLQSKNELYERMNAMQEVMESIDVKLGQIDTLKNLKDIPVEFVTEALPAVRHFGLYERSDLKDLVDFEKNLIVMIPYQDMCGYRYGVFVPDAYPHDGLIRKKDLRPRTYLKVLLQTSYDRIEKNNLQYYYDYLEKHGYQAGLAMGKVLVSSNDKNLTGQLYNYYETWIEAVPLIHSSRHSNNLENPSS